MASWNTVTLSDATKSYAWDGVMREFKEDAAVPNYAKALLELLVEERRELLETQQEMVRIIGKMERKVNDLACAQLASKSDQSSSNHTPVDSDSSNEPLNGVNLNLSDLIERQPTSRVEIVPGLPLPMFCDAFPTSTLRLPKVEGEMEEDEVEDYDEGMMQSEFGGRGGGGEMRRLTVPLTKGGFLYNQKESSSALGSTKRKRPHSSGESLPGVSSISEHYCRYTDCDVSFETAAELEEHVKGHTYTKKHHCPVCGLGIRSETRLRDHMNQHTGARPYVCEYCGKGFTRTDAKNGHLKKCSEKEKAIENLQQLLGGGPVEGVIDNDD